MDRIKLHQEMLDYLHNLFIEKDGTYGNSTHDTYAKYGMVSYMIRLEDKLNRARNLVLNERPENDERLEDSLLDLANYAIIAVMELRQGDK